MAESSEPNLLTDPTQAPADRRAGAGGETWLTSTWPLAKQHWVQLGLWLVLVVGAFTAIGLTLTDWTAPNDITQADARWAESLAESRTEPRNDLSKLLSMPADTFIKIAASIVIAGIMLYLWRRWHEAVFVGATLIFEATAFIITSFVVGRPRPDVEQLLHSPVDTSFPSGHVAAATVYGAVAIIVFWHTRNSLARFVAAVISIALPVTVAWARVYQGMHYVSDVVFGILLGIVSLLVVRYVLGRPADAVTNKAARG